MADTVKIVGCADGFVDLLDVVDCAPFNILEFILSKMALMVGDVEEIINS